MFKGLVPLANPSGVFLYLNLKFLKNFFIFLVPINPNLESFDDVIKYIFFFLINFFDFFFLEGLYLIFLSFCKILKILNFLNFRLFQR